jgi:hypothetical protein
VANKISGGRRLNASIYREGGRGIFLRNLSNHLSDRMEVPLQIFSVVVLCNFISHRPLVLSALDKTVLLRKILRLREVLADGINVNNGGGSFII